MAYKACGKEIVAGAVSVTPATTVGYVRDFSYSENAERIDATVSCDAAFLAGQITREFTFAGFSRHLPSVDSDSAQDSGQALFVVGNNISIAIRPQGTGTGKPQLECLNCFIERMEFAGTVDGAVTWNVSGTFNVAPTDTDQA